MYVGDVDRQNDVDNALCYASFWYSVFRGFFPVGTVYLYSG
jgi:hypothetical protein